jgi:tetratricopeptide (TPR) repeat protein
MRARAALAPFIAAIVLLAASCKPPDGGTASREERRETAELFSLLSSQKEAGEPRFVIVQRIALDYLARREYAAAVSFLAAQAAAYPADPYDAYLYFLLGYAYVGMDARPMASLYFHRALRNYPDQAVKGESVHLACLKELIAEEKDPSRQAAYYREILARFPSKVDVGALYFQLGKAYETLGDWDLAIQAYKAVLPYPETVIPGFPGAYQYARKTVDFANSSKDWTFEDLDELVSAVRAAIAARDPRRLEKLRAKVNFFAMSWAQEEYDENSQVEFDLSAFMGEGAISVASELDPSSNSREAFLRTTGWTDRIPAWFLYFRKIDFPANPDIHGRWEWAGIYYGEKLR